MELCCGVRREEFFINIEPGSCTVDEEGGFGEGTGVPTVNDFKLLVEK